MRAALEQPLCAAASKREGEETTSTASGNENAIATRYKNCL